jgi:hypothetical protein
VVVSFGLGVVTLLGARAEAKTITVTSTCTLQNAVQVANNNSFSGTSCTGDATGFDLSTLLTSPTQKGDIVQLQSGTHNYNVGDPGLEIYSAVQIHYVTLTKQ